MPRRPSGRRAHMGEHKEQDPKLDHPTVEMKDTESAFETRDVDKDKLEVGKPGDTPDKKVEQGDDSAVAEEALQDKTRGFGTQYDKDTGEAVTGDRTGGFGGRDVKIEDKNKSLSKEDVIQKPSGTGDVRVGGEEVLPKESQVLLDKAKEILNGYGNQEANIPVESDYWVLMNKYRALHKDEQELQQRELEQKREDERKEGSE